MDASWSGVQVRWRQLVLALVVLSTTWAAIPADALAARCGGTERWFVKVGTDPSAGNVDTTNPISISVAELNALPNVRNNVPAGDNRFRLPEETKVYVVQGFLALFKNEDDADYHLIITDASQEYTPGGPSSTGKETGTSFIAEIPDLDCVPGMKGSLSDRSVFETALQSTRAKFEARFPGGKGADKFVGIPVTVTGVAFYDRQHHQTGRAVNGFELHPVLDIAFGDTPTPPPLPTPDASELLANTGFEDGPSNWSGSTGSIGEYSDQVAHGGAQICWLGGYGKSTTETIAQTVSIPSSASSVTLKLWINIQTEETTTSQPYDQCTIQLRTSGGAALKTLDTLSNLNETAGYLLKTYDVTAFKGRTVKVYIRASEDTDKATSFILDDFSLAAQ